MTCALFYDEKKCTDLRFCLSIALNNTNQTCIDFDSIDRQTGRRIYHHLLHKLAEYVHGHGLAHPVLLLLHKVAQSLGQEDGEEGQGVFACVRVRAEQGLEPEEEGVEALQFVGFERGVQAET